MHLICKTARKDVLLESAYVTHGNFPMSRASRMPPDPVGTSPLANMLRNTGVVAFVEKSISGSGSAALTLSTNNQAYATMNTSMSIPSWTCSQPSRCSSSIGEVEKCRSNMLSGSDETQCERRKISLSLVE